MCITWKTYALNARFVQQESGSNTVTRQSGYAQDKAEVILLRLGVKV